MGGEPSLESLGLHLPLVEQDLEHLRNAGRVCIPIVSELPFGHDGPNATLPVGILAELDADSGVLSFGG